MIDIFPTTNIPLSLTCLPYQHLPTTKLHLIRNTCLCVSLTIFSTGLINAYQLSVYTSRYSRYKTRNSVSQIFWHEFYNSPLSHFRIHHLVFLISCGQRFLISFWDCVDQSREKEERD